MSWGGFYVDRRRSAPQVAFSRLRLGLVGEAADQADEAYGDGGADQVAEDVDPPPGEVGADDVGAEGAGRVHGGAADRAGEQAEQRDRGADRDGRVVADAPASGGGMQDHADQ